VNRALEINFNFLHISPLARINFRYFLRFLDSGVVSAVLLASGGWVLPVFFMDGVLVISQFWWWFYKPSQPSDTHAKLI